MWRLLLFFTVVQSALCLSGRPRDSWVVSGDVISRQAKADDSTVDIDAECEPEVLTYHFKSAIKYRYATTLVHSRMANCGERPRELNFTVTLPENAFISQFAIEMGGVVYRSHVKEKEQADHEYQDAVQKGVAAAQVSLSGRDLNVYHVFVNVEPRSEVVFNLTYEEMLTRRLNAYNFVLTPNPGQVVDDLSVEVTIQETKKLLDLQSSFHGDTHRHGALDADADADGDGDVVVKRPSTKTAVITFRPRRPVPWKSSKGEQLRLQYDVERTSQTGDVLLMDGYFVHFFAPRSLPTLPKHVIFAIDTSGSMWGRKLEQTQDAITSILTTLRSGDYFSIVSFGTEVTVWTPYQMSYNLVGIRTVSATHEVNVVNLENAIDYIKTLKAAGGTNVEGALRKSIQIAAKREYRMRNDSTAEPPKPIIIFLTDGIPTNGELRSFKILALMRAANTEVKAPIFSLAFGDEANQLFLKKLSLQHNGFSRRIYEAADASLQLQSFYQEISSPLLSDVNFVYKGLKVNRTSVTKSRFHTYYGGSELVVAGRILDTVGISRSPDDKDESFGTEVQASTVGKGSDKKQHEDDFEIQISANGTTGRKLLKNKRKLGKRKHSTAFVFDRPFGVLEKMWAHLSIRQHLDKDLSEEDADRVDGPAGIKLLSHKEEALRLALKYQFVTSMTSLVVVKSADSSNIVELNAFAWETDENNGKTKSKPQSADLERNQAPMGMPFSRPLLVDKHPPVRSTTRKTTVKPAPSLDSLVWLEQQLDADGKLVVPKAAGRKGGSFIVDRTFKEQNNSTLVTCKTPSGDPGTCRILMQCVQEDFTQTFTAFLEFFCPVGMKAGVCCPRV